MIAACYLFLIPKRCTADGLYCPFDFYPFVRERDNHCQFRFVAFADTADGFVHFHLPYCGCLRTSYPVKQNRVGNIVQLQAGFLHPYPPANRGNCSRRRSAFPPREGLCPDALPYNHTESANGREASCHRRPCGRYIPLTRGACRYSASR